MNILKRLWAHRHELRSLPQSIYFNFHYLPFKQAIHLPILLYKPHLLELKGSISISCMGGGKFKYGMIRLGFPSVSIYPNSGIMYENHGGSITFHGEFGAGNNSYISIGQKAQVEIGTNTYATSSLRLVSYDKVNIGDHTLFGWNIMIMDTDFHTMKKVGGEYSKGHAPISIGSNNWFGNGCKIYKRTTTPDYIVVSADTILAGKVDTNEHTVIGSENKIIVKATGLWHQMDDDVIEY